MDVNQCYLFLQFLSRKNQAVSITPKEFEIAFNTAQRQYADFLIGHIEQFQYGNATPRVALGMSSKISSDLAPFKVDDASIPVVSGVAAYPNNFYYLALITDANSKKISWISDDKLPSRLSSKITPFNESGKSFYNEGRTGWNIYGAAASGNVFVTYYETPQDVVWGFNIVSGRPVYNPATSVQPLWGSVAVEEVLGRAARLLGLSFEKQSLTQYGEQIINRGE